MLALELGYANVDAMLASMPRRMLTEWLAFFRRNPFGEERADLRAGIIASAVANAFRGKGRAARPADFMPRFGKKKKQNMAEMRKVWESFCEVANKHGSRV